MSNQKDWFPIQFQGMVGDPSVVDPGSVTIWTLRDCELYHQKIRPRKQDKWVLNQSVSHIHPEWVHSVYWIPHPIDFPLIRAWLVDSSNRSLIGSKGLFYTPHMTAGYFLLDKNRHLVVRFMGYLENNLSDNDTGLVTAVDPSEFYSWMKQGYLQIVSGDIENGYHCEIVFYQNGYVDENRRFIFNIVRRGELGTSRKSFSSGARVFSCFPISFLPAPEIIGVQNTHREYAKRNRVNNVDVVRDFNPNLSDVNDGWDKPVFVAPTISLPTEHNRDYPPSFGEINMFINIPWHGIGPHGKTDTSLDVSSYAKYPPRLDHDDDDNYYNNSADKKFRNRLLNNWDVYTSEGYAYWRSLWVYRTVENYSQWYDTGAGGCWADHARFPVYYSYDYSGRGYIPQVQMATIRASGGRNGMAFFILLPPDPDYYWVVYRVLKHPFKSAADASNYSRWNIDGGVMIFPYISVFGVPLELESSPQSVLKFRVYHGSSVPSSFLTTIPPDQTNFPDYARPKFTSAREFLQHKLDGHFTELNWSYEQVSTRRYTKRLGEITAPKSPFLQIDYRNVKVVLPDLGQGQNVWAFAIGMFLMGTSRECGGPYIDFVPRRSYRNGQVVTHLGLMLLWDPEEGSYTELPSKYLGDTDNRQVGIFSPRYSGNVRGRVRAYSAILWRGTSASRAADVFVQHFSSDWNSPVVSIKLTYNIQAGDVLVLYEMTGTPRAVGLYTFHQDISASPQNPHIVEVVDTDANYDYPFVWATEPLPYGPAISYENRLLVLDQSVWCSALGDYPSFTAYPRQKGDGFRVLLSSPVDRLILLENQAVAIGPRGSYRIALGELVGEALPYPVSVGSDIPFVQHAHLQDYSSYAVRRGLVYGDQLVYILPEDWIQEQGLITAYVVQTPYGPALIRHYVKGSQYLIRVLMPAVGTKGYTEYYVDLGTYNGQIVSVQWYDGLYLYFDRPLGSMSCIRVAGGTERVGTACCETGAVRFPFGLRPRMIELYGSIGSNRRVRVRYYEHRPVDGSAPIEESMLVENSHQPYPFDLSSWGRKLVQLQLRLELEPDVVLEGGAIRLAGGIEP